MALRLLAPEVDAGNVAAAEEYGTELFINADGEEVECDETPLWDQAFDCRERIRWALLTVSNRESVGNWSPRRRYTGIHKGDSHHASNIWKRGHKIGRLNSWCPAHWTPEGMSTIGPHGLMYGYHVQRLGVIGNCVPTWTFGIGHVSASVAARFYLKTCESKSSRWCPSLSQVLKTKERARRRRYWTAKHDRHVTH